MQIQQLIRTDPEKVFVVVKNVDGSGAITAGLGAALVAAGASIDGVGAVIQPATTYSKEFAGVATQDIPINGYGLVQAWGLANSILISNEGTSVTLTAGDQLWPSAVAGQFNTSNTLDTVNLSTLAVSALSQNKKLVTLAGTVTLSAAVYAKGLVRAL